MEERKAAELEAQEEEAPAVQEDPADPDVLSQETLRKYITFAKEHCHPKLANADQGKISQVNAPIQHILHA